ncbi:MAG: rhodanese-like domain-containing protein [Janthinobacterium lividum]
MNTQIETSLAVARQRVAQGKLPYAGAVLPAEAWALLSNPEVVLVDVRTSAERAWVGKVMLEGARHVAVEWNTWPAGTPNPRFVEQLRELVPAAQTEPVLLFLCRSGVRSRSAAMAATQAGFTHSYDILEGFEGDKDGNGHRKTVAGWCKAGLPWVGA